MKDEKDTKDEHTDAEGVKKDSDTKTRNHVFEKLDSSGLLDNMFKDMTPKDQEEWKDFTAKTVEHYDRLIRMIEDISSTEAGRKSLQDEINRRVGEK